jgi:hypothetical protein
MIKRTKEEERVITGILLYLGAHWPTSFIPETDLNEAANEFWGMTRPDLLLQLVIDGKMKVEINTPEAKARCGCWLMWGFTEAGRYEVALNKQKRGMHEKRQRDRS